MYTVFGDIEKASPFWTYTAPTPTSRFVPPPPPKGFDIKRSPGTTPKPRFVPPPPPRQFVQQQQTVNQIQPGYFPSYVQPQQTVNQIQPGYLPSYVQPQPNVNPFPKSYVQSPSSWNFMPTQSGYGQSSGIFMPNPPNLRNLDSYIATKMEFREDGKYAGEYDSESGAKISVQEMAKVVEPFLKTLFENNDFAIRFKSKDIKSIQDNGFWNMFQIAALGKAYFLPDDFERRIEFAGKCFGISREDYLGINIVDRERYGFLRNYNNTLDEENDKSSLYFYGDVNAILDKDKLFNVTTFTLGDSLANRNVLVASRVSDPKICSIPGVINGDYSTLSNFYSLIKEGKLNNASSPLEVCELLKERLPSEHHYCLRHIELQFHGQIPWKFVRYTKNE